MFLQVWFKNALVKLIHFLTELHLVLQTFTKYPFLQLNFYYLKMNYSKMFYKRMNLFAQTDRNSKKCEV